ncbi:MAG: CoA-binding protein [Nitrososphaeraceae archaeon]
MDSDSHSDSQIKEIYQLKNIAVIGVSKNEEKPSHQVPEHLIEHSYNVIPVNPTVIEVLGRKCYPSIADINERIDIVDVFRKSEDIPAVVDDILKKKDGIKVFWMQLGIYNEDAEMRAKQNDIDVVYNKCMMEEHKRLFGDRE